MRMQAAGAGAWLVRKNTEVSLLVTCRMLHEQHFVLPFAPEETGFNRQITVLFLQNCFL